LTPLEIKVLALLVDGLPYDLQKSAIAGLRTHDRVARIAGAGALTFSGDDAGMQHQKIGERLTRRIDASLKLVGVHTPFEASLVLVTGRVRFLSIHNPPRNVTDPIYLKTARLVIGRPDVAEA